MRTSANLIMHEFKCQYSLSIILFIDISRNWLFLLPINCLPGHKEVHFLSQKCIEYCYDIIYISICSFNGSYVIVIGWYKHFHLVISILTLSFYCCSFDSQSNHCCELLKKNSWTWTIFFCVSEFYMAECLLRTSHYRTDRLYWIFCLCLPFS